MAATTTTTYTLNIGILNDAGDTITTMKFENPKPDVTSDTVVAAVNHLLPSSSDTSATFATGRKLFTSASGEYYAGIGKIEYVETTTVRNVLKEKA